MSSQDKQPGETPGKHDDVLDSGTSKPKGVKGKNLVSVEVAVPLKQPSPFEDSSSSGTQSRSGLETPATSITVTPAESDTTSSRPHKRVNASARALELRNSSYSLNNASSSKKRGINEISNQDSIDSDARLARALQAEEYADSSSKRVKHSKSSNFSGVHNSTDDENDDLLLNMSWDATDNKATTSRVRSTANKGKTVIPDSDASSLSELDLDASEMGDVAAEIEDVEMEEDEEYEESEAEDRVVASEEDTDEDETPAPVVAAPIRPSARSRQRAPRPSRARRRTPSRDLSPSMRRLPRRVRLPILHFPRIELT